MTRSRVYRFVALSWLVPCPPFQAVAFAALTIWMVRGLGRV
jgi:hypothetical protein